MYIGPIGQVMSLSQNVTLVANTQYSFSFYYNQTTAPFRAADGTFTSSTHTLSADIEDGAMTTTLANLLTLTNYPATGYTQYTQTFTPTVAQLGGSTGQIALVFTFRNDDSYWSLDDIEVTAALPTISKAFNPATIPTGGTSVVTLTLTNGTLTPLTGGAFTDTLANMSASGGSVTGTCTGTTPSTLAANATNLSFTGINLPASNSCTVIFSVTSSTPGAQPNTTSGITTTQTTTGAPSNTATLTVLGPPTIGKAFNPATILTGKNSLVTLTLTNGNLTNALTGASFTDTLVNMSAVGGAVAGTCSGTTPTTLTAAQTALSFSGIAMPANSNCTVTFSVTSTHLGGNPNHTSGAVTNEVPTAGPVSNTATLTVQAAPVIVKAFNPATIPPGANSTVTLTLTNNNAFALTGGALTDTLVNMSAVGGPVTGTCAATGGPLTAGQTALSFSGIRIPANGGSCTVIFSVTSSTPGAQPNTTSGATTNEVTSVGDPSNTATLTVLAPPTISKAFNPSTIPSGGTSTVTLTLTNSNPATALTGASFSDTLTNMSAVGGNVTGTCTGTTPGTLSAGQTSLSFGGITIPANSSCTVVFSVTSSHGREPTEHHVRRDHDCRPRPARSATRPL